MMAEVEYLHGFLMSPWWNLICYILNRAKLEEIIPCFNFGRARSAGCVLLLCFLRMPVRAVHSHEQTVVEQGAKNKHIGEDVSLTVDELNLALSTSFKSLEIKQSTPKWLIKFFCFKKTETGRIWNYRHYENYTLEVNKNVFYQTSYIYCRNSTIRDY